MIAVLQKGYNLYGVGVSILSALDDAREWLGRDDKTDEDLPVLSEADDGEICWAHCSKRLADAVANFGSVPYDDDGNRVYTEQEGIS